MVVADLSIPDRDIDYLLGIAHGLGRKVVLTASTTSGSQRGAVAHCITPESEDAKARVIKAIQDHLHDPFSQGPVAGLLADEWVFGEPLTGRRCLAFLVDVAFSAGLVLVYSFHGGRSDVDGVTFLFQVFTGTLMVLVLYRSLCLVLTGTTLGLRSAGLQLVNADGGRLRLSQALGRSLATYLAVLPFAASLGAVAGPRYQVIEDWVAGTRVVRRNGRPGGSGAGGGVRPADRGVPGLPS